MEELTESIKQEHLEFLTAKIYLFEKAISIGGKLLQLKSLLPHGKFMSYVKTNLPLISRATSNNYMTLSENEVELREKLGNDLELKKAYQYLRLKNNPTKTEKTLQKAIETNNTKLDELKEKRKLLGKAERRLSKGIELDEPDKTIAKTTFSERLQKAKKQVEKYEKLLNQITNS